MTTVVSDLGADARTYAALGSLSLPIPPAPVGNYQRGIVQRGIGFLSGQFPLENGTIRFAGQLGNDLSVADGQAAARLAALNTLAQIKELLGSFDLLDGLIRVDGFVACTHTFTEHAAILNGASDAFVTALGPRGLHARSAMGVGSLPMNAAVELVVTFAASGDR